MSKPGISVYHRPDNLEEAWTYVAEGDPSIRLLSGGADLSIHAPPEVTTLVDVGRVLSGEILPNTDGSIYIGAMATLTAVMEHPAIAALGHGVVPEMMVHVGNPLLRNFSTIGGHVARGKLSDVVPVLLALDTHVTYYTGEETIEPMEEYYDSGRVDEPHVLTGLTIPALPENSAASFLRFARTVFDFAILNVCSRVDAGGVVKIVFGATPRRSQRATNAEAIITEKGLTEDSIAEAAAMAREEIYTGGGWVASPEYRTQLVGVLAKRSLGLVAERLEMT